MSVQLFFHFTLGFQIRSSQTCKSQFHLMLLLLPLPSGRRQSLQPPALLPQALPSRPEQDLNSSEYPSGLSGPVTPTSSICSFASGNFNLLRLRLVASLSSGLQSNESLQSPFKSFHIKFKIQSFICISHLPRAQWPHASSGYCIGQGTNRIVPRFEVMCECWPRLAQQKVLSSAKGPGGVEEASIRCTMCSAEHCICEYGHIPPL